MNKQNNKPLQAVALAYDLQKDAAPKVLAKGRGTVAAGLIEKAREHNVPIQEDSSLVELLGQLQINETIPEQLYNAVAEVFAFIYQVDKQHSNKQK